MIRSSLRPFLLAWSVLSAPALFAQSPAGAKAPDEKAFLEAAAKKIDAYATLCFKNAFPRKARAMWQLVLSEYDGDDAGAREALGFAKVGTVWQPKADFVYPENDTPNAVVAETLRKKWDALAKELGDGHRDLAQQMEAAGNQQRSQYHFDRVLKLVPGDSKSAGALGRKNFEGLVGTEVEINLVKRSRQMERAVVRLLELPVKTEPATGEPPAPIKAGNVAVTGFKSEHFTVWGDWDTGVLQQLAAFAERALLFCNEAFSGYPGWPPKELPGGHYVFYQKRDTWASVVRANASRIGAERIEFILANTSANTIGSGKDLVRLCGAEAFEVARDYAVRQAVQEYSRLGTDGMQEGIGHAAVGMFFGRNLIFLVGQEKQKGTVTGHSKSKLLLPDTEVWQELAVDMAWQRTGTSPAQLPLLKAASFPNDGRILAWSFCDYLLRRDPSLLRALDDTSAKARNEADVKAEFQKATGQSLQDLEDGWRHYWTDDSPLRRAITQKVTPLEAASKDAPHWLEEFNKLRAATTSGEVGWSSTLSAECRLHADYLQKNKGERGPEKEHAEDPSKPGYSNGGRIFAPQALVSSREKEPHKAMAEWLHLPGYRDAILNRNIDSVGLYVDGIIAVMDGDRGAAPKAKSETRFFPIPNLVGNKVKDSLPASLEVADLGPDIEALLKQNNRGKQKSIGYPVSLHGYGAELKDVSCKMTLGGQDVPGILLDTTNGKCRCSSARNMWVFWPWDPLKRGQEVKVVWNWRDNGGAKEIIFTTQ